MIPDDWKLQTPPNIQNEDKDDSESFSEYQRRKALKEMQEKIGKYYRLIHKGIERRSFLQNSIASQIDFFENMKLAKRLDSVINAVQRIRNRVKELHKRCAILEEVEGC